MVFLSVQLKSFYWPAEMKVTIKKNTQTSPLTTVQPTGVGTPPITLPAIPTAGRHIMHWSKERTWKLQHYLPMCGFLVYSENGIWFDGSSGHHWQVARGVWGGILSPLNHDVGGGLATSTFLEGFQASPGLTLRDEKSRSRSLFFFFLRGRGWSIWPEDRVEDMLLHPRCGCPRLSPSLTISSSTPKKLKTKMGRKGGPNIQIPKVPHDKVGCLSFFYFYLQTKMP